MNNINLLWKRFLKGDKSIHWLQIWNLVVIGKWTAINNKKIY